MGGPDFFCYRMFLRRMEDQISRGGASFDAAGQQTSPVRRLLRRAGNFEVRLLSWRGVFFAVDMHFGVAEEWSWDEPIDIL